MAQPGQETLCRVTRGELLGFGARFVAVVWMQHPLQRFADQVRLRPPERGRPCRIHIEKFSICIRDHEKILRNIPGLETLISLCLHPLLKRFVELTRGGFGTFALGYIFCDYIDAYDPTIRISQWMPVGDPDMVRVAFVCLLPAHLDTGNGLTCVH